jgi:hypothetical protein
MDYQPAKETGVDGTIQELQLDDVVEIDCSDVLDSGHGRTPLSELTPGKDVAPGATFSAQVETVDFFESAVRDFCEAMVRV